VSKYETMTAAGWTHCSDGLPDPFKPVQCADADGNGIGVKYRTGVDWCDESGEMSTTRPHYWRKAK
jgi:hypothetical protein